ncbi:MAG: EAL domain-containing protein [Kangiellaceae bacterium]|nr:EAL domain-containing protein [Kangiellaceae bacterium]
MEKKRPSTPFKVQLSLMLFSAVAVAMLLSAGYFFVFVKPTVELTTTEHAIQQAQLVGKEAISALQSRDNKAAKEVVKLFSAIESVDFAAIVLPNKTLLGNYSRIADMPLPNMALAVKQNETGLKFIISEPIVFMDKQLGYVYVEHDSKLLFESNYFVAEMMGAVGFLMLVVTFLLAGLFQKLLTNPITKMVSHINHIHQSKEYEKRLVPSEDGEIGRLVKGFNQMLDAAQERESNLSARGKQLQKLVDVRTKQLFQKAHYDSLTSLPNRYLLVDRLHQAISKSARTKSNIAVLYLDLDRFKMVNDTFGHQNGDLLLKEVAKRFKETQRDGDTVARLGGDEFVFLLENLKRPKDAARTALRIIECFNRPFQLQEHNLHMSTSIGISVYPDDGLGHEILLKNSDISMYDAKKKGPGNFSFFSEEMNNASLERLAIEENLRKAIENDELTLVYQPQKNLQSGDFRNVEALVRWNSPTLGQVSPGEFIPIAEETGLINKLDLWVISEVCKQLKIWNDIGVDNLTVAINVSAGHLISNSLLEHIKTEIIVNQLKAEQLEIEITEQVFIEQTERTIENLRAIKALGAKIAIDDFGTGYSSLQYIQDFPADTLKLDGMFIQNLRTDKASQGIVRSTIILAHSLGLELVAECVEDEWQLDFLTEHKCDLVQGYIFSKPLPPQEIPDICNTNCLT